MVITVYSDRRSHEVADVASRLAAAFVGVVGGESGGVLFVTPRGVEAGDAPAFARASLVDPTVAETVGTRLAAFARQYAATVVALTGAPNEQVLAAFDASDRVLLVSDPSVASVRGTQRALKLCASLGYDVGKVDVVLRDFAEDAPFAPADAAVALKRDILWVVPGQTAAEPEQAESYTRLARRLIAPH